MATTTSSPPIRAASCAASRITYSCVRCAERKVKCDRQQPCRACMKHNVECVFKTTKPLPEVHRKTHKRVKDQILIDKLTYYETLLKAHGIDPQKPPSSTAPERTEDGINKPRLVHSEGKLSLADNPLWTRLAEDYQQINLEDSLNSCSDGESSEDDFHFVLSSSRKAKRRLAYPSPEDGTYLWSVFVDRIDPLTKIVHVPTLRPKFLIAANSAKATSRSFEALIFAVYGAAVMSLNDVECSQRFSISRKELLSRYMSSTKLALSRADFLATTDTMVLTALVFHLLSAWDIYKPRSIWTLTGVAVRIAQGIGLDKDGMSLGLSPFETEMRRRLWWMLKTHDFRTAELVGMPKFRDIDTGSEGPAFPTNISEDQLFPGMTTAAVDSGSLTDMMFIVAKHELTRFARSQVAKFRQRGMAPNQYNLDASGSSQAEIKDEFGEVERVLESKYLHRCDPSQPLHVMTMLVIRVSINMVRFLSHHPRRWGSIGKVSVDERHFVWTVSINLLEQQNMLLSSPMLKRYAWQAPYFQPWGPFIHVLDCLKADPLISEAEKAWALIAGIFENVPTMITDRTKPINIAVGNMCLAAYRGREDRFEKSGTLLPPKPAFIARLELARVAAKAKREAHDRKMKASDASTPHQHNLISKHEVMADDEWSFTTSKTNSQLQSGCTLDSNSTDANTPSWPSTEIDGGEIDVPLESTEMVMDIDLNLDFDFGMPNWDQWDSWLAESNLVPPSSAFNHSAENQQRN